MAFRTDTETDIKRILDKGVVLSDVKIIRGKDEELRLNRRVRIIDDSDFRNCLLSFDGETFPILSPFDSIFRIKKTASQLEVILIAVLFLYGFVSTFINIELLTNLRYEFSISHGFALFVTSAFLTFATWALSQIQVRVITIFKRDITNVYHAENDPHFDESIEQVNPENPYDAVLGLDDLENLYDFDTIRNIERAKIKRQQQIEQITDSIPETKPKKKQKKVKKTDEPETPKTDTPSDK